MRYPPVFDEAFIFLLQLEGGRNARESTTYGIDARAWQKAAPLVAAKAKAGTLTREEAKEFYYEFFWKAYHFDQVATRSAFLAIGWFADVVNGSPVSKTATPTSTTNLVWSGINSIHPALLGTGHDAAGPSLRAAVRGLLAMTNAEVVRLREYVVNRYPDMYSARAHLTQVGNARKGRPVPSSSALKRRYEAEREMIAVGKYRPAYSGLVASYTPVLHRNNRF